MKFGLAIGGLMALTLGLVSAQAQEAGTSRSPLPEQPYSLFYPPAMSASGEIGGPVTIRHPEMPLQCTVAVVPVEDTGWSAQDALSSLDPSTVAQGWGETLPGFAVTNSTLTNYQSAPALLYEGSSAESNEGGAVTLVHTESVDAGNGYTLDCLYPAANAADARPLVDAIIANFSTRQDASVVTPLP